MIGGLKEFVTCKSKGSLLAPDGSEDLLQSCFRCAEQ